MRDGVALDHPGIRAWIDEVAAMTRPDRVVVCDGSEAEKDQLTAECVASGELIELNQQKLPGCYLHRSAPHDVARTEHLTFICTDRQGRRRAQQQLDGAGRGARQADAALHRRDEGPHDVRRPVPDGPAGIAVLEGGRRDHRQPLRRPQHADHDAHGPGRARAPRRSPTTSRAACTRSATSARSAASSCTSPRTNTVWSIGSGYGGNALLGKKCMALRLASWLAQDGRLARRAHADPRPADARTATMHYVAGAFPSACGKTNLAMLVPPPSMPGWKAWTVGDDIAWLRPGADGRLWAVNPEAGFFGVVPGTSRKTNPNAFDMIQRNTIYTNVALRPDGTPWWEGHDDPPPAEALDWQGRPWTPASTEKAAHPEQPLHDAGRAVRVALAGVRQPRTACRSTRSCSARAGSGACRSSTRRATGSTARSSARRLSSETTAAATGKVGVLRRDPMAMLAVLRLQHGRLLRALARGRREARRKPPQDLPRELVPHRTQAASSCGRASATTCAC